jgi:hypothetical protein
MRSLLLAALLLASFAGPSSGGEPRIARLESIQGLTTDLGQRGEFLEAFRAAFEAPDLSIEARAPGGWTPGAPLPNRFRLEEGSAPDAAWTLEIVVGLPPIQLSTQRERRRVGGRHPKWVTVRRPDPKHRASRGMNLVITVIPPDAGRAGLTPEPERVDLGFPVAPAGEDDTLQTSESPREYPWAVAGRAAGLLALEALHRRSGDLGPDQRLQLPGALRADPGR